jgi:hypothetical protein
VLVYVKDLSYDIDVATTTTAATAADDNDDGEDYEEPVEELYLAMQVN